MIVPQDLTIIVTVRKRAEWFSMGTTSRSRSPAKLQYEPRIHTVQHGYYDIVACATKYGRLALLVLTETPFSPQNLEPVSSLNFGTSFHSCHSCHS